MATGGFQTLTERCELGLGIGSIQLGNGRAQKELLLHQDYFYRWWGYDKARSLPRNSRQNILPGACANLLVADPRPHSVSFGGTLASPW